MGRGERSLPQHVPPDLRYGYIIGGRNKKIKKLGGGMKIERYIHIYALTYRL